MGQVFSSRGENLSGNVVDRVTYESLRDRCQGMEQLNNELKNGIKDREKKIDTMGQNLYKTKSDLKSTQNAFIEIEKQLSETRLLYDNDRDIINELRTKLSDAIAEYVDLKEENDEVIEKNKDLQEVAKKANKDLADCQEAQLSKEQDLLKQNSSLKKKNANLRIQAHTFQEELTKFKRDIGRINEIVDACDTEFNDSANEFSSNFSDSDDNDDKEMGITASASSNDNIPDSSAVSDIDLLMDISK